MVDIEIDVQINKFKIGDFSDLLNFVITLNKHGLRRVSAWGSETEAIFFKYII